MENTDLICEKIGYKFKNTRLLERALTHSSFANENGCCDNERLEFLGDSVLSLIISEKLHRLYENTDEGGLSKMRASLVCEQSLEVVSREIGLGELIRLGKGEERMGGRKRASIISDAFEALIAAIYLDSGLEEARKWVLNIMRDSIKNLDRDKYFGDFKTRLQELAQSTGEARVSYKVVGESGKEHMKNFVVAVCVNGEELGRGEGSSKKDAEQKAAAAAVKKLSHEAL